MDQVTALPLPERVLSVDEWNGRSNTKFFKRYEGPYRLKPIHIANHPVRKVLERQFEYMSRNLYFISAFGRFLLDHTQEDKILKAEEISENTIKNAMESMRKRIEQARVVIESAGNTAEETHFSKQQVLEVPLTTRAAGMYAELLKQMDEFYTLNYMLWVDGEIDSRTKFKNESDARTEVQRVVRGIASQFLYILKLTNTKNANEASKAGVHNEQQLEEDAVKVVDQEIGKEGLTNSVVAEDASATAGTGGTTGRRRKTAAPAAEPAAEPVAATA